MSNWKLILLAYTGRLVACAPTVEDTYIELFDGRPLSDVVLVDGINVSFDGTDTLVIDSSGTELKLSARTPSTLYVSPDHEVAILNFGDGSGQVLDIAAYRLTDGSELDVSKFRVSLNEHARGQGCQAAPDAASIIFKRWLSETQIEVSTEDFSRTLDCSALIGTWQISVKAR